MILVVLESLVCLEHLSKDDVNLAIAPELMKSVGKVGVNMRTQKVTAKLSFRLLWYLPVDMCSVTGIQVYRTLLETMQRVSLGYALLS